MKKRYKEIKGEEVPDVDLPQLQDNVYGFKLCEAVTASAKGKAVSESDIRRLSL